MTTSQHINHGHEGGERPPHHPKKKIVPRHVQEKLAITYLVILLALFALSVVLYRIVDKNSEEYTRIVL